MQGFQGWTCHILSIEQLRDSGRMEGVTHMWTTARGRVPRWEKPRVLWNNATQPGLGVRSRQASTDLKGTITTHAGQEWAAERAQRNYVVQHDWPGGPRSGKEDQGWDRGREEGGDEARQAREVRARDELQGELQTNCNSATSEGFTFISKEEIITQWWLRVAWERRHSKYNLVESALNSLGKRRDTQDPYPLSHLKSILEVEKKVPLHRIYTIFNH